MFRTTLMMKFHSATKTEEENKMAKITQIQRVLNMLKRNKRKGATSLELWQKCGCYRASGVIHVLRRRGYNIITEDVEVKNQFGESCIIARYVLK